MDGVYRGFDIPKLYLRRLDGGGDYDYECVDGQQRMRTVWDFFANASSLSEKYTPELAGKRYEELIPEERHPFETHNFSLVEIRGASDAEIREMFCRLQNGMPLNAAERRNAMVSAMRDFVDDVSRYPFYESVRFGNNRKQHQQVAAQTVALEVAEEPVDVRNTQLERLYENQKNFTPDSATAKRVKQTYGFLHRAFPEKAPELKRGLVVSLYYLVSDLSKKFNLKGRETQLREFIIDFEHARRTHRDEPEWIRFGEKLSHSSDSADAIDFRHRFMLERLHESIPDLVPLDGQRGFTDEQRTAIYRRDGGKCFYCGEAVKWDEFEADHVIAHTAGGPTDVRNGRIACSRCNRSKGARPAAAT